MTTNQQKARSFRLILKSLIRNSDLSTHARFLWVLIDSYADHNGDSCFPSTTTLSRASGHPVLWVKRHLNELKEAGFVKVGKKKTNAGWVNSYHLNINGKKH